MFGQQEINANVKIRGYLNVTDSYTQLDSLEVADLTIAGVAFGDTIYTLVDISNIGYLNQEETVSGIWTFSDSAYIDTLAFSRIFGLDSLNVDSLNFIPQLELSDSTAALRTRIESKSDSSLVGYLAQDETVSGQYTFSDTTDFDAKVNIASASGT